MKFGLVLPNCHGDFSDVRLMAEVAYEAEQAGWDGVFVWDHIGDKWGDEVSDPWVMLTAIALRTQRVRLGTMVTPLSRRRPWQLSREIVTLDQISNGRMILGVGSGGGVEYTNYHEPGDAKMHGAMLDEALDVLIKLWSGERFDHHGQFYHLDNIRHLPVPVQQPRIPIWVGGVWPRKKPMQRAALWDGACPVGMNVGFSSQMSPEQIRECITYIRSIQTPEQAAQPFDMAHWGLLNGHDPVADQELAASYKEAGATWWMENVTWERGSLREQRARFRQGPPRIS